MRPSLLALSLICCAAVPAFALDNPPSTPIEDLKQAGREIGHATRDAAKDVGHATRDTTRAIGHATRDTSRKVGHATPAAANQTGHAARHGPHSVKTPVIVGRQPAHHATTYNIPPPSHPPRRDAPPN